MGAKEVSPTNGPDNFQSEPVGITELKSAEKFVRRAPASTRYGETNGSAEVVLAKGSVSVIRIENLGRATSASRVSEKARRDSESEKSPLNTGDRVQIGDRILTGADGRVRLRFSELSEIFVSPNSGVVVEDALLEKRDGPAKRTIIIDLKQGRLRSRVQGRYNDGESRFQVKTRAAVAGVRGTDFVVSFDPGQEEWKTEVQTLSGEVCFGRGPECEKPFLGSHVEHKSSKVVYVGARSYATFVSPAPPIDALAEDVESVLDKGVVSPVFRMTEEEFERIQRETEVRQDDQASISRLGNSQVLGTADGTQFTCSAPSGAFNQCSWTCEGKNPKGSKRCQTDLPGVRCVRRLCRANGQWAEPTALPAMRGQQECEPNRPVVRDCGIYW